MEQPPSFVDFEHPNHFYKFKEALYGLKQAPKYWYERLRNFLIGQSFIRGQVDHVGSSGLGIMKKGG